MSDLIIDKMSGIDIDPILKIEQASSGSETIIRNIPKSEVSAMVKAEISDKIKTPRT